MAELADAADSKSAEGNFMGVQLPLPAPRYVYTKPLIIHEVTAPAISPQSAVPALSPIFQVQKRVQSASHLFSIA
jgi:hypothetical protein